MQPFVSFGLDNQDCIVRYSQKGHTAVEHHVLNYVTSHMMYTSARTYEMVLVLLCGNQYHNTEICATHIYSFEYGVVKP